MKIFLPSTAEVKACVSIPAGDYRLSLSNVFSPAEIRIFKGEADVTREVISEYAFQHRNDRSPRPPQPADYLSLNAENLRVCLDACISTWMAEVRNRAAHDGTSFEEACIALEKELLELI